MSPPIITNQIPKSLNIHSATNKSDRNTSTPTIKNTANQQSASTVGQTIRELQSTVEDITIKLRSLNDKRSQLELSTQEKDQQIGLCDTENRGRELTLERAKMSHEDIMLQLMTELSTASEEAALLRTKCDIEEQKGVKLDLAIKTAELQLETENEKMRQLVELKKTQDWLSISQLSLTKQMHSSVQEIRTYQQRLTRERAIIESLKKKQHNTVQEFKGNIRVFCRFRPPIYKEISEEMEETRYEISNDAYTLTVYSEARMNVTGHTEIEEAHEFTFDGILSPDASQEDVFAELSQLVQCSLDGYNVSIFAYGQTGSGKTYTMEGPEEASRMLLSDPEMRDVSHGMIPRAVHLIFDSMKEISSKGWVYAAEISILEIYNETVRDLLADASVSASPQPQCEIKFDVKNNVSVTNLKIVPVSNSGQVLKLLGIATKNRASAATQCNDHSSRSHSVFQFTISGENSFTNEAIKGVLSLIDLAGSERVDKSQVTGERLRETFNINKSLSSLGDVISALGSKKCEHIPFRNSKLTTLLKDSLGGNAKTLMLVNLSPLQTHVLETINSLRFAAKVNSCTVGVAKRNIAPKQKP